MSVARRASIGCVRRSPSRHGGRRRAAPNAKLAPGGYTGWHGHVSQSLGVVKTGQITMYAPGKRACEVPVHNAGTTFVHPEGAHNFVNTYVPPAGQPGDTEF